MSRIKIFFILLPLLNHGQLTVLNPSFECSYFDGQWWSGQINHSLITEINPNAKSDIVNDGTYYYTLEVGHTNSDHSDESYSGVITIF